MRRRLATQRLISLALLALLLGQWAVLGHAIGHARGAAGAVQAMPWSQAAPAGTPDSSTGSDALWGHAAGAPSCQLVDHLLVGQATGGEPPPLLTPAPADTRRLASSASPLPGALTWAYAARGPPAV